MAHEPEPILGRYRFLRRLPAVSKAVVWLAHDAQTGREVVASLLPASRATGLEPVVGMSHPHMAQIIAVLNEWDPTEIPGGEAPHPDSAIVLADHVLGGSLHQRLQSGRVEAAKAAKWAERLADVLTVVHRMGGVHGAISPRSILVTQTSQGVPPLVTHLVVPPAGAFCSPDRVTGGGPSEADDVWALAATLYTALAGHAPFLGSNRKELARAIVRAEVPPLDDVDPDLVDIVRRGLRRSAATRLHDAAELHSALVEWLRARHVDHHEQVETNFPDAPSDRPSVADDRALQDAVVRPESREASLPVSARPPPAPPRKEDAVRDEKAPALAAVRKEPEEPATTAQPQVISIPKPPPVVRADASRTGPVKEVAAPSAAHAPSVKPRSQPAGRPRAGALSTLLVVLAGLALVGIFYFFWQRSAARTAGTGPASPPVAVPTGPSAAPPATAGTALQPSGAEASSAAATPATSPRESPVASSFENPTACMVAALPEGTFGTRPSLDFVCNQADVWGSARRLSAVVNRRGRGEGARMWAQLTRYELPAIAMLRTRCCEAPKPLTATTVRTSCTPPLTDVLRGVAAQQSDESITRFEETFQCLAERRIQYPGSWKRMPPEQSRVHFDAFRAGLR